MADNKILIGTGIAVATIGTILLLKGTKKTCEKEGSFKCIGNDMYQCIGGKWVLYAENYTSCMTAECIEGNSVCRGNDLYKCVDGKWILEQQNHPDCVSPTSFSLYGNVIDDENGVIVIGARVAIDGLSDSTNGSGNYQFTNLSPRNYTGSCTKEGYLDSTFDIFISKDTRLDIRLNPVPGWPYVALAICPYCGQVYYAPDALDKLFEHVEAEHLPAGQGYYFCGFCGAEFTELMELFCHWVDKHLIQLTQVPEASVYLPEEAMPGDNVSLKHIFNLTQRPGGFYTVNVRLVKGGEKPYISSVECVAPDLLAGYSQCFPGYIELDHTGQYTLEETVAIPADLPEGEYSIFSVAKYQHINKWGTGCGRSYDQEFTVWNIDTGKKIYIGTPVTPPPPPPAFPCSYCGFIPSCEDDLIAHMESYHPNKPYILSGHLDPVTIYFTSTKICVTPFVFNCRFFTPPRAMVNPPSDDCVDEYSYLIYADLVQAIRSIGVSPENSAKFHDLVIEFPIDPMWHRDTSHYESVELYTDCYIRCTTAEPRNVQQNYWWQSPTGLYQERSER